MHRGPLPLFTSLASAIYAFHTSAELTLAAFQSNSRVNTHSHKCAKLVGFRQSFMSNVKLNDSVLISPGGNGKERFHSTSLAQSQYSSSSSSSSSEQFQRGGLIQVEVTRFGNLGASVDIIGVGGHSEKYLIDQNDPPLGTGLILQSEISYFRRKRDMLDVVVGEILPAYVEHTRQMEDGSVKVDVSLRQPGNAKTMDLATEILQKLQYIYKNDQTGTLDVGDKSTPKEIDTEFPGASKSAFKKAISSLYKQGKVKPSPFSITLMK